MVIGSVDVKNWLVAWFSEVSVERFLIVGEDTDTRYGFMYSLWGWLVSRVASGW